MENFVNSNKFPFKHNVIGVFSTEKYAKKHVIKLKDRPEFKNYSEIKQPEGFESGFRIIDFEIDETKWEEGFETYFY